MARETRTLIPVATIFGLHVGQEEVGEFWAGRWSIARNADGWRVTIAMPSEPPSPAWERSETFDNPQSAIGAVEALG